MRPDRHNRAPALLGVLFALLAISIASAPAQEGKKTEGASAGPLTATLEVLGYFVYEGDPLRVRVSILNVSDKPYDSTAAINLLAGLKVSADKGGKVPVKVKPEADMKRQPAVLAPGGFFGIDSDITTFMPDVSKAGTYTITWEAAGLSAPPVKIKVLPKFDPTAAYVAVLETDYGYLEFDLKTKEATAHVKNFYDLSLQGAYDNTVIHQVIKGVEMRGGDLRDTGWPSYALAQEIATGLTHKRGTLSSMPVAPGQDSGSQFVVTLAPLAQYDGALSIFGEMRKGEEVLTAIENIPTTGQKDQPPYFRPLKPVVLRSVTVKKASAEGSQR